MKSHPAIPILLAVVCLHFLFLPDTVAEQKTEVYDGFFQGEACEVTINWANYSGQGNVDGRIQTQPGIILPFYGNNPRKGYMEIDVQGVTHYLNKTNQGGKVSWSGASLSFSRGNAGNNPGMVVPPPVQGNVTKAYVGTWRGAGITANLNFTPDHSDTEILFQITGLVVKSGIAYSLSGYQPRADYLELSIDTDPENHKMSREVHGSAVSWVGRWVSLTERSPAGNPVHTGIPPIPVPPLGGPISNPPTGTSPMPIPPLNPPVSNPPAAAAGAVWVIACEAQAGKAGAEAAAAKWRQRGFDSGVVWIPDYSSLSGAKMYLTYVGWYDYRNGKSQGIADLPRVRQFYPKAYGIKLDQSGRRETF